MHVAAVLFVFMSISGVASTVGAGISVSSYDTQAQANAYAPLSQASYYDTHDLPNMSPATAAVSDDWSGTNAGGSTNTWRMVAAAHIGTTTNANASNLTITGSGSFSYEITTVAGFVDPSRTTTLYGPGAAGAYECDFSIDAPATYAIAAKLNQYSVIQFGSVSSGDI